MLKLLSLFAGHAALSFIFAAVPVLTGPFLPDPQVSIAVWVFVLFQVATAGSIILTTSSGRRWIASLVAVPAMLWALWCGFIAAMAYSGNWL
jgi:hypothetical protein